MSRQRDRRNGGEPEERVYWRSQEQLAGDPTVRDLYLNEFAPGASEPPHGLDRRDLMTLMGATLSMAGVAACRRPVEHIVPFVYAPEDFTPGVPRHYASTMPFGAEALGVVATSHEGRPTKIEGNPAHPASAGGTSVWMQASMLQLYDPDRSQRVLRDGQPSSWDDFAAAWGELEQAHLADGGAGLAVLSESFASPTLFRLAERLRERFPNLTWATFEPVSDENALDGTEQATGAALRPLLHVDRAQVILSLDSDFLVTETDAVRNARGFARGRRVEASPGSPDEPSHPMSRLYVVEAQHSVTGANADHRLRMAASRIPAFLAALLGELGRQGLEVGSGGGSGVGSGGAASAEGFDAEWLRVLASDLLAHRGSSLVLAGRRQRAAVHAAVAALNAALGNAGATVDYVPLTDVARPRRSELADLVADAAAGSVSTLVILGANPAYNAPADLDLAAATEAVANVVHFGYYADETSALCNWHLPQAHFLESWGDARALDGTLSVVQPLIEPLFAGRSTVELLGLLAGLSEAEASPADVFAETAETAPASGAAPTPASDRVDYHLVRETWRELLPGEGFEDAWNRVLHDGLLAGSELAAAEPSIDRTSFAGLEGGEQDEQGGQGRQSEGLELVFSVSPSVFDGRFANNGWLQELPDAMTKLTWDNAILLSPATARSLGVEREEVATLSYRGHEIEGPVWTVPGQADETVVVELGYGRRAGGQIAAGAGFDVYVLRTADSPDLGAGAVVAGTGRQYLIAQTQDHHGMEGRPLVREASLSGYRQQPDFAKDAEPAPHTRAIWEEEVHYDQGYQWGMTIDLNACVGCNACVVACQSENNIPVVGKDQVRRGREMQWLRLDRYFIGSEDEPETVFQALPCMQCENAPCEQVCPVAATVHDSEGLNVMVYNRCIGTRYCLNNCPYKVRRFNFYNFTKRAPEIVRLGHNPEVTVRSRGVMEKCTYCTQRIAAGRAEAKLEGREIRDGDVRTACQQACPAEAIEFGNILDGESRVARAKAGPRNYTLLDVLLTRPRTSYLAKIRNPHPELAASVAVDEGSEGEEHAESH